MFCIMEAHNKYSLKIIFGSLDFLKSPYILSIHQSMNPALRFSQLTDKIPALLLVLVHLRNTALAQ